MRQESATWLIKIVMLGFFFSLSSVIDAFSMLSFRRSRSISSLSMGTATMPSRTQSNNKTRRISHDEDEDEIDQDDEDVRASKDAPLEWLEDEWSTREPEDPFHIILLGSTFERNKRVTVSYVSGCVTYVLGMPEKDANELTNIAAVNGMSCLGTWEREECLKLGRQLRIRDISVRVVPFCKGGSREWQAKDAGSGSGEKIFPDSLEVR
jgi:hypothetical protein